MKKWHLILIAIGAICVIIFVNTVVLPTFLLLGGTVLDGIGGGRAEIEIDSYRLCQDEGGRDVIIVKYLLKNKGGEATSLYDEGDICVYQNGVQLTECYDELPRECDYDSEDQMKYIKGGKEYYAEIAYWLENTEEDVEVEVNDYGLFDSKKQKVFTIQETKAIA